MKTKAGLLYRNIDIILSLLAAATLICSLYLKASGVFWLVSILIIINDFKEFVRITKKQDERVILIKSKANEATYFILLCFCLSLLTVSTKHPEYFRNIPELLNSIITFNCLVHSTTLSLFKRKF